MPRTATGYAISWLYLGGDVTYETYKAHRRGPGPLEKATGFSERTRLGMVAAERATFQAVASMALPALTIHTVVAQSARLFKNVKNPRLRAWGPTGLGLAVVPALPYFFDHPVEHAAAKSFDWLREQIIKQRGSKGHKEL